MIPRDPMTMTPDERLAELAEALAAGYLRLLVSRGKAREVLANVEAPCGQPVNEGETAPAKEIA